MWEQLLKVLDELIKIHEALLKLSRQKQEILVAGEVAELEVLTKQAELLIREAGIVEAAKTETVAKLSASLNLAEQSPSLMKLRQLAEPATAEKLEAIEIKLNAILQEVKTVNGLNTKLLQNALNFVNYNINLLTQTPAELTYAPQTQSVAAPRTKVLFDGKA